jgi:hypothetical protein
MYKYKGRGQASEDASTADESSDSKMKRKGVQQEVQSSTILNPQKHEHVYLTQLIPPTTNPLLPTPAQPATFF